ncbi:MAG TPA: DUF2182 domain-containing protein [Xanthobacteraceae bacterium]|nr:DUF2182 domain-containing protein [Xanthobacteraceae bacterium]
MSLVALGWVECGYISADQPNLWTALCRPAPGMTWSAVETASILGMWTAMTLAMMLPAASPMILTYAEIADTAARVGERVVSPLILIAGYLAVWFVFALAFTAAQMTVSGLILPLGKTVSAALSSATLAGIVIIAAGAYQFSSIKHACLYRCQRPFPFFFANWTDRTSGVFKLGLRQGLYCLGCCWALMLVMFALGAMNIVWMAVLGVVMTIEKMTTTGRFARALGVCLMVVGALLTVIGSV